MKRALPLFLLMVLSVSAFASSKVQTWKDLFANEPESSALVTEMPGITVEAFLDMTPKKYEELTGKKMGISKALRLKAAQKVVRKKMQDPDDDVEKTLYIVLAIFGLGFVGIGILDDWTGSDWIIALVLALLCWLPGVIYALVKMKNYY